MRGSRRRPNGCGTTSICTTSTPGAPPTRWTPTIRIVVTQWQLKAQPGLRRQAAVGFPAAQGTAPAGRQPVAIVEDRRRAGRQPDRPAPDLLSSPARGRAAASGSNPRFMGAARERTARPLDKLYGPVATRTVQLAGHPVVEADSGCRRPMRSQAGADFIETDHYKLTFDPAARQSHRPVRQEAVAADGRPRLAVGFLPAGPRAAHQQRPPGLPRPQRRRRTLRPDGLETRLAGDAHQLHRRTSAARSRNAAVPPRW